MNAADLTTMTDDFHRVYYDSEVWAGGRTSYLGIPILKCPLDLWIYQELLFRVKPRVIIETGTFCGGSAIFLANTALLIGIPEPLVITIDLAPMVRGIRHPRVLQLIGSSTDPKAIARCQAEISKRPGPVTVILDSDHHEDHVRNELELYAPLVTSGSYLIVEDTNINGRPVFPEFGPGPGEALDAWLPTHPEFVPDLECEKFGLTFNPGGYLRRIG